MTSPQQHSIDLSALRTLLDDDISHLAIVAKLDAQAWTAWVDHENPVMGGSTVFAHALGLERDYAAAVIAFDEIQPPIYGACDAASMKDAAARVLDAERIVCLVVRTKKGRLVGLRDYDKLDMTDVIWTHARLEEFHRKMSQYAIPSPAFSLAS